MATYYCKIFPLMLLSVFFVYTGAQHCAKDTSGKHFVLGFMEIAGIQSTSSITITTKQLTHVRVMIPNIDTNLTSVEATNYVIQNTKEIPFNNSLTHHGNGTSHGRSIVITSDKNISVFLNIKTYDRTYHTFKLTRSIILPTDTLSTDYIISSYRPRDGTGVTNQLTDQVLLVSLTNFTHISLTGYTLETNVNIVLNEYESYHFISKSDLSGLRIKSDQPLAVFYTQVKVNDGYRGQTNILHQQVLPSEYGGITFVIPPFTHGFSTVARIYSTGSYSHIQYHTTSNSEQTTLYEGIFLEIKLGSEPITINADQNVMIVLYGTDAADALFASPLPALEQFLHEYSVDVPYSSDKYVAVMTIQSDVYTGILIDNHPVVHSASVMSHDKYTVIYVDVTSGSHTLTHAGDVPFGVILYGYSKPSSGLQAFAYPAGLTFTDTVCSAPITASTTAQVVRPTAPLVVG